MLIIFFSNNYYIHCPTNHIQTADPLSEKIVTCTEEGKKVIRNNGDKFVAIFRRIRDPCVVNDDRIEFANNPTMKQ